LRRRLGQAKRRPNTRRWVFRRLAPASNQPTG
jgi:hypothetical protein